MKLLLALCPILLLACGPKYRVLRRTPGDLLRSPDSRETPLADVLHAYNGFQPGLPFVDLRPLMELRVENAYYQPGSSRRGLAGYLGTEIARYEITGHGLNELSVQPLPNRPAGDPPVQDLIPSAETRFRCYRFYYEIVFSHNNQSKGSVLLAGNSIEDLDALSARLAQPESVCNVSSSNCAIFPEACSVSIEMQITVNGKPQSAVWGSLLASIVTSPPKHLDMVRLYQGRLQPVIIGRQDAQALRLPLLPGDQINWSF